MECNGKFKNISREVIGLTETWTPRLLALSEPITGGIRNSQNRTIKEILGHLIDSASNNMHRIVYLHYKQSPFHYPNYATHGDNDKWIAIQHYQIENWNNLVQLWKYMNLHLVHLFCHVNPEQIDNVWIDDDNKSFSMGDMIQYYLTHLQLHLTEIETLISAGTARA